MVQKCARLASYHAFDGPAVARWVVLDVLPSASAMAEKARAPVRTQILADSVSEVSIVDEANAAASRIASAANTQDWSF